METSMTVVIGRRKKNPRFRKTVCAGRGEMTVSSGVEIHTQSDTFRFQLST